MGNAETIPDRMRPERHLPPGLPELANDPLEHYDYCQAVRELHEEAGGTKADRRIPLWTGTATPTETNKNVTSMTPNLPMLRS